MIADHKQDIIELRKRQITSDEEKTPMKALQSITINPTELCNRTCHFCPRSNPKVYPNQNLHISEDTIRKLDKDVALIKQKLDILENNHLAHIKKDVDRILYILGAVGIVVLGELFVLLNAVL